MIWLEIRSCRDEQAHRACISPVQVLAVDPDNGENGTVIYSISPANAFYTINNVTGKIRTSGVTLDRESSNPSDSVLMRTIVISAVDRECHQCICFFH